MKKNLSKSIIKTKLIIKEVLRWDKKSLVLLLLCTSIGMGCVIFAFCMMETFKVWTTENIESLGAKRILLWSVFHDIKRRGELYLSIDDILPIEKRCPNVKYLTIHAHAMSEHQEEIILLRNKKRYEVGFSVGVWDNYGKIMGLDIKEGRFLQLGDMERNVCMIEEEVAKYLDANVGDMLQYKHQRVKIIGIVKVPQILIFSEKFHKGWDTTLYIPLKIKEHLHKYDPQAKVEGEKQLNMDVYMKTYNVDKAIKEVKKYLQDKYGEDKIFDVFEEEVLSNELKMRIKLWQIILMTIGGCCLLGSGCNILFSLLAIVSKKKKEIGIKRAAGAKKEDIFFEVLVESCIPIFMGSIIGIIIGIFVSFSIFKEPHISLDSIIASMGLIMSIAIVFSLYPAVKAANLPPVEVIRYE